MFRKIKEKLIASLAKKLQNEIDWNLAERVLDKVYDRMIEIGALDYDAIRINSANPIYYQVKPVNYRDLAKVDAKKDVTDSINVAQGYLEKIKQCGIELNNKNVLEIGPGTRLGTCAILAHSGATMSIMDKYPVVWQEAYHQKFYNELLKHYPDSKAIKHIKESKFSNLSFFSDLAKISDGSQDIVVSNAVLEHVGDFKEFAAEMKRVTRSGGIHIHQVDFRDHRDFDAPLEYLLYDEETFTKIFNARFGECGHQRRAQEVIKFFEDNDFVTTESSIGEAFGMANMFADEDYLSYTVARLRKSKSKYKNWMKEDLRAIGANLILRKN